MLKLEAEVEAFIANEDQQKLRFCGSLPGYQVLPRVQFGAGQGGPVTLC